MHNELRDSFQEVKLEQIPRGQNSEADALAKLASQKEATMLGVITLEIQKKPSVPEEEVMQVEGEAEVTWMTPLWAYIKDGTLPADKMAARRLRYRAARYVNYEGALYKRGYNQPLLRCVAGEESFIS